MKAILVLFILILPLGAWAAETIFFNTDRNRFEYANGRVVPHNMLEAGKDYQQIRAGEMQFTLKDPVWYQEFRRLTDDALTCLTKMEAVMRAMDEFVPSREPIPPLTVNTTVLHLCQDDDCIKSARLAEAEAQLATVKRREDAISEWRNAKHTCWRATGSPGTP